MTYLILALWGVGALYLYAGMPGLAFGFAFLGLGLSLLGAANKR